MNETSDSAAVYSSYSGRDLFLLLLYLLTAVTATLGNLFVCVTIYKKKRLTSTTYILIFNMAISDVVGGLVIPGQWLFCSSWSLDGGLLFFGVAVCGLLKLLQILSYYISSLTMVAISYDRFCLVCRPMSRRPGPALLLVVVWSLGLLFILTMAFSIRVSEYFSPEKGLITCRVIWLPSSLPRSFISRFRLFRFLLHLLTQYVLPLLLTAIFYGLVMRRVWAREQVGLGAAASTAVFNRSASRSRRAAAFEAKKRQTVVMLAVVTALFAAAYLPTQIWHLLMFTTSGVLPKFKGGCYVSTFYMLCYWLAISSCALNPFIYVYYNSEFRKEALKYWLWFSCRNRKGGRGRGKGDDQIEEELKKAAAKADADVVEHSGLGASSEMVDGTMTNNNNSSRDGLEEKDEDKVKETKLGTVDV